MDVKRKIVGNFHCYVPQVSNRDLAVTDDNKDGGVEDSDSEDSSSSGSSSGSSTSTTSISTASSHKEEAKWSDDDERQESVREYKKGGYHPVSGGCTPPHSLSGWLPCDVCVCAHLI